MVEAEENVDEDCVKIEMCALKALLSFILGKMLLAEIAGILRVCSSRM